MFSLMKNTFAWCIVGFLCFSLGGTLRMYMVIRVKGWAGYLGRQTGITDSYRQLVIENQAPAWPLPMSYTCIAVGIAVAFGAILIGQ
jgi:hypothetical protein